MDTDIDAVTPMFPRYSTWIGETLRSVDVPRSSGRWLSCATGGSSGTGAVVDVGDDPQPVATVELARLGGDVRRRVVQAEERVEVGAALLGDHLAVPLGVEPVHHDPVEPRQGPDPAGGIGCDRDDLGRPLQRHRRLPHDRPGVASPGIAVLDLDDEERAGPVQRRRERAAPDEERHVVAPLHPVRLPGGVDGVPCCVPRSRSPRSAPSGPPGGASNQSPTFAEATAIRSSGSVTASSAPCGWIAPGTWIGSAAQLSRLTGAVHVAVTGAP